jgi:hypothetical protein
MGNKICSPVYLNAKKENSADYYGNLHLGHDAALKIYLKRNAQQVLTKFQKAKPTFEELVKLGEEMGKNVNNYDSVTSFGKTAFDEFQEKSRAKQVVLNRYARKLVTDAENPKVYNHTVDDVKHKRFNYTPGSLLMDEATAWAESDEGVKEADELLEFWESLNTSGKTTHKYLEEFVNSYVKFREEHGDTKGDPEILEMAIAEAIDQAGVSSDISITTDYKKLFKQVHKIMTSVGGNPSKLRFLTEYKIEDAHLGTRGVIDLVVMDEHDNVYIFDYKTKEANKEFLWDFQKQRCKKPIDQLWDNAETKAMLQTSLYRKMFENLGFNVKASQVVYIESEVGRDTFNNYFYHGFNASLRKLDYDRTSLARLFKHFKDININEVKVKEEGKRNGMHELLVEELATTDFEDTTNDTASVDNRIRELLAKPWKDDATGKMYFWNKQINGNEFYINQADTPAGKEDRRKQLKQYFKDLNDSHVRLSDDFLKYARDGVWPGGSKNQALAISAQNLLNGVSSDTHIFSKLRDMPGFEDSSPRIILAINKVTDSARIINLNDYESHVVEIAGNEDGKQKNILQNLGISDKTFKRDYGHMAAMPATDENFKMLRMGMIAMELKKQKVISSVEAVVNGVVNKHTTSMPNFATMKEMLPYIQIIADKTKTKNSAYVKSVLEDKQLNNFKAYENNALAELEYKLANGLITLPGKEEFQEKTSLMLQGKLDKDAYLNMLRQKHKQLADRLIEQKGINNKEVIYNNDEYILLSQVILQLMDVHLSMVDIARELEWDANVRISSHVANEAVQYLDQRRKFYKQKLNDDMLVFQAEHDAALRNLTTFKQKSMIKKITSNDMPDIFSNLFIKPVGKDMDRSSSPENLFKLKDPEDKSLQLDESEKEYIRIFNKWILKGFEKNVSPEEFKNIEDGKTWSKGYIPLLDASLVNQMSEADTKEAIKMGINSLGRNSKNMAETYDAINTVMENKFLSQLGPELQGNRERRTMLGINADGEPIPNPKPLETNLEKILYEFTRRNYMEANSAEILGLYNAMNTIIHVDNRFYSKATKNEALSKYLDVFIKMNVLGEYKNEGKLAQRLDATKRVGSVLAFALSIKLLIQETGQNFFSTASAVLSQAMMGKEKRFSVTDFIKAGAIMTGQRAKNLVGRDLATTTAVIKSFGLYNADPESWSKKDKMLTRKNGWYQSKWLYHLNSEPFKMCKSQIMVATLVREGIWDALSTDEFGMLKYDSRKDERFTGIFDQYGKVQTGKLSEELSKKRAAYEYLVKEATEEGTLDENGLPKKPLTMKEINSIQDYSLSVLGSIDDDARTLWHASIWGRMLLTFRSWAPAKKDAYWTKRHLSKTRGNKVWIADPDLPNGGEFKFEDQYVEGILQTLDVCRLGVASMFKDKKLNKQVFTNLDKHQKENLAKLSSDLLMVAIMTLIISNALGDDDDEEKSTFSSKYAKMVQKQLLNATNDLNAYTSVDGLLDGSALPAISAMFRVIKGSTQAVKLTVMGDPGEGAIKFVQQTGIGRSIYPN